ncbi:hypothetical protein [Paraburkholderia phenoliruptrix]|uniref:Uncharacterized protein n=2 Tax=Paraburkholderia phenoliruptrix TaxID=252970 RepID=K0E099_9BURK|nr:hypothetical protein [Paraburkholderia phenoliruptrix]AFT90217.1 hypothetical protein BUPH_05062 [Paraburkholderia phenoliruptrix BR3459a]CAB4052600.1 hypothetical protein LMG9964_06290 [Paraburkholderia phenoliruptrix]
MTLHQAFWHGGAPFGCALAQQIFAVPEYHWTLSEVAQAVGTDTGTLQMRLFREAYSFASSLKRCRMLRLFLSALSEDIPPPDLSPSVRNPHRLDSMFKAAFQTRLTIIEQCRLPTLTERSMKRTGNEFQMRNAPDVVSIKSR